MGSGIAIEHFMLDLREDAGGSPYLGLYPSKCQINLICIACHLEQLAKIVTVGIILGVSNVALSQLLLSLYFIQELM